MTVDVRTASTPEAQAAKTTVMKSIISSCSFVVLCLFFQPLAGAQAAEKPNVRLIIVGDLKPTLGGYGGPHAKTTPIDAPAARGLRIELDYCNQAGCASCRFTLIPGITSSSTRS